MLRSAHPHFKLATALWLLLSVPGAFAQTTVAQTPATQTPATPTPVTPTGGSATQHSTVRAITFFLNLDRAEYQSQITDAFKSLRFARPIFESRGYTVQQLRIATQPFADYTNDLSPAQAL